jgi:hypothetical protein
MRRATRALCLTILLAIALDPARLAAAQLPAHLNDSLYNLVGAPSAAFVWFPALPHTGEQVTLVSTSTDFVSPIVGYGWDLTDFGVFAGGGPAISTTFSTPANHVVRLRVTSDEGLSSVADETIAMSPPPATVMYPFPVVRIVGIDYRYGTKIKLLKVEAPAHARVTVECRGKGCPVRSQARSVPPSRGGVLWVTFKRFERLLRPGASLRIRVSKSPLIGSYTRFTIRRGRLPVRVDSCLSATGIKPILCPS